MTIMWSAASCSSYLLNFMNKYLEGTIYQNNYNEQCAALLAVYVGANLYAKLGKKTAFIFAYSLALGGGILIYLLESKSIDVPDILLAQYEGGPIKRYHKAVAFLIPEITFFAKFGVSLAFLCTYQASFSDQTIFPTEKRATAIGTCQFFARGITILAPEIAELPAPRPIMFFCGIAFIALCTSFSFASDFTEEF